MKEFDLIIIGQGSTAFASAIRANSLNLKTLVIGTNNTDGTLIGGTCVNVGCVPSKYLIINSRIFKRIKMSNFTGFQTNLQSFNFKELIESKSRLVEKFRQEKYRNVIDGLENVKYINGKAIFQSTTIVQANNEKFKTKFFIIATGARLFVPKIRGIENIGFLSNEEALNLQEIPKNLCVIGAGALGLEFANMFSNFGSNVTILQRGYSILTGSEPEISHYMQQYLEDYGINIYTNVNLESFEKHDKIKKVNFKTHEDQFSLDFDEILLATGRTPNIENIGLEKIGIKLSTKSFIMVNEYFQTEQDNIYAGGDVIGSPMLEPLAAKHGAIIVDNIFNHTKKSVDNSEIPKVVFTNPEIASVGYTDLEANQLGFQCSCNTIPLNLIPKAVIIGEEKGIIKMVINKNNKRILGIHLIAPNASEIIHEATLLIKFKKTIDDLIDVVHVFPTLSECLKLVALSFYMDITKLSCCTQ